MKDYRLFEITEFSSPVYVVIDAEQNYLRINGECFFNSIQNAVELFEEHIPGANAEKPFSLNMDFICSFNTVEEFKLEVAEELV